MLKSSEWHGEMAKVTFAVQLKLGGNHILIKVLGIVAMVSATVDQYSTIQALHVYFIVGQNCFVLCSLWTNYYSETSIYWRV